MGRNKYIGKWTETGIQKIDLSFTKDNLALMLRKIISTEGLEYSEQGFVNWCENFYWAIDEAEQNNEYVNQKNTLAEVLNDISVQWDLYLVNTFSLEELQTLDFSLVRLPSAWFDNWLNILENDIAKKDS
jgi:hypothetical protein